MDYEKKIKELEKRLKNRHPERTYNFYRPVGQIIEHVDTVNFKMDKDGTFHFENVGQVNQGSQSSASESAADEEAPDHVSSISKSFCFPSEFTKQKVDAVVKTFYKGEHAELALIEVTLYDHKQLRKRNKHTAFVKSLVAWGILKVESEKELKQIVKGITDKYGRLPNKGYMEWGKEHLNDKNTCIDIGKLLGETMPYNR